MPDENDYEYTQYGADFFAALERLLTSLFSGGSQSEFASGGVLSGLHNLLDLLSTVWNVWVVVSWILSFLLIYGIIYAYIRANQLAETIKEIMARDELIYAELHHGVAKNDRFEQIKFHLDSNNPNDWRLAIIEADIVLGELLDKRGYAGSSIGEQLKSISPRQLQTLDEAWEAHKVRNQIAHAGADFILTKKLARDTIGRYQRVFTEFGE